MIKESLKNSSIKGLRFRTKVILTVETLVILVALVSGIMVYNNTHTLVREILRNKLISTAVTTAASINKSELLSIQIQDENKDINSEKIKNFLKQISNTDDEIDSVYIMEKSENDNILKFVIDSTTTEDTNNDGKITDDEMEAGFGEEYDISNIPEMKDSFIKKTADHEISCDKWGCWLSGYAPILNDQNETMAIVGVDISANQIMSFEKKLKISLLSTLFAIAVSFPIFLFFYFRISLKPISEIYKYIEKFSGDFSSRMPDVDRKDEFGLISRNFNRMADELTDLVKNMEEKVEERTREIAKQKNHIEAEKNKTESILKSIGDGVFVVDKDLKITMFNKISEDITGYSADQVLGKKYSEVFNLIDELDDSKKNDDFIKNAISTGETQKMPPHTILINKDGHKIPVADSASPLKNAQGIPIGCVVVFRDISHEYEIDKAKTEFVSLASHQLRTPLSSINWYAEMLLNGDAGKINKDQKNYLEEIYFGNQRMIELVNALLNVSRLEMGTFLVEPRKTNIIEMANDVIKELIPRSTEKNITIKTAYAKDLPEIKVDPKLMRIIFQNLLSNSIKYTPAKGKIELKISKDDRDMNIEVSDNGMGIPESQKDDIFSKFFRADNVRQTDTEGTGLGLYLLKSIIDHSEGKIRFESTEGKGTTFFVSIPLIGMKAKKGTKEITDVNRKIERFM